MAFDFSMGIDPNAARAIYLQILDIIEEQLQNQTLKVGDMLPSEKELCQHYHVSRTTIRQTLRELEDQGMIVRQRGLGTFISEPKVSRRLGNLYSFTEDMKKLGLVPTSKILNYRLVLRDECAAPVQTFQSDRLIEVVRLRLANDRPMLIERTFLSVELCPDLSWERLENNALYAILSDRYGLQPYRAVETYEAVIIARDEGQYLQCNPGEAAFLLRRQTWDESGRLIEYTKSIMPSSRSKFEITMYHDSMEISRKTL